MKKIISLLIVLLFLVSCIPVMADPVLYETIILDTDFSSGFTDTGLGKPSTYNDNYQYQTGSDASGNPITSRMIYMGDGGNSDSIKIYTNASHKAYVYEADYYFPHDNSATRISLRKGSTNNYVMILSRSELTICDTVVALTASDHHHVKFSFNVENSTCNFYIDQVEVLKANGDALDFPASVDELTQIRLCRGTGSGAFAIDNLKLSGMVEGPSFVPLTVQPAFNSGRIAFNMQGSLLYTSLNTTSVALSGPDGNVELSEVNINSAADKIFSILPKYNLTSNTSYTVTINESAMVSETQSLTEPVSYTFTTAPEAREISNVSWSANSGNIIFEADLASASEGDNICIIISLWDGNNLIGIKAVEYTYTNITADSHAVISIPYTHSGYKLTACVVSDINNPSRIGKPIYQYIVE